MRNLVALPVAALVAALLPVSPAHAVDYFCFGEQATIVGTEGPDEIVGTHGRDVIVALGGDDYVSGHGMPAGPGEPPLGQPGNDLICAGEGNDQVADGFGDDRITGGPGNDEISHDDGNDVLQGGPGNDTIPAHGVSFSGYDDDAGSGSGRDLLLGADGEDLLLAGEDDDRVLGGPGTDDLDGSEGDDTIRGHGGRDRIRGSRGTDSVDGDAGRDSLEFQNLTSSVTVDLADNRVSGASGGTVRSIRDLVGSSATDELMGDGKDNVIRGGSGDDTLNGGGGRDSLDGQRGTDTCLNGESYTSCERRRSASNPTLAATCFGRKATIVGSPTTQLPKSAPTYRIGTSTPMKSLYASKSREGARSGAASLEESVARRTAPTAND